MRFLADENVSRQVVERLRADGHDVIAVTQSGQGVSDKHVVEMANAEGRILITEDRDFGELVVGNLVVVKPARLRLRRLE